MIKKFILFFVVILIFYFSVLHRNTEKFEDNNDKNNNSLKIGRPWVNLFDQKGNIINVILLSRPFFQSNDEDDYKDKILPLVKKKKLNILGISSYQEFPNQPFNPYDGYNGTSNKFNYIRWVNMTQGWLHCFREPNDYIPKKMPKLLLSESDFIDCNIHKPNNIEKKYDFMYVCHRDDINNCSVDEWVAYNKNLELAEKCFKILCKKKKLKGILIGRAGCDIPKCQEVNIETTQKLDYNDLKNKYDECKIIFVPNVHDASPRVLCEGLCHNLRCLVNKELVGGWKYVNKQTGEFFTDENDFEEKIDYILNNYDTYQPRNFFTKNYSTINSGKKLKKFIYDNFDNINVPQDKVDYITPEVPKESWVSCDTI